MLISRRTAGALIAAALGVFVPHTALAGAAPQTYREFIEGNPKARVTVVEYASLTCPHCAAFHATGYPRLKAEYIDTGKIKFIYRDLPTDGLAGGAALLARCAPGDRGKTMIGMMFENQQEWTTAAMPLEVLRGYAQLAGMSAADVDACLKNEAIFKEIRSVQETAITLYKVEGTPTFIVGDEKVNGVSYEALKAVIEKQLK